MVTGCVIHNDTPLACEFACSDPVMTRFWKNTQWTQRANFVEMPTDCPQRDERLGWMGDAQIYVAHRQLQCRRGRLFHQVAG